jgi:hypothetical protein
MQSFKIILIILLIIIQQDFITAQEISKNDFRIGVTGGYGYYFQSDLKKINQDVKNQLSFETKLIDNFPPAFFWGIHFLYKLSPHIYIGPNYQFHTTGSRLGYKDYSGSYTFDQILSCNSIALQIEGSFLKEKKTTFCLNVAGGANFSKWKIIEELIVGEQNQSSSIKLSAIRPFIYPSIKLKYSFISFLSISMSAGYSFDLGGRYKIKIPDPSVSNKIAKWTGPRAEFSIDYSF